MTNTGFGMRTMPHRLVHKWLMENLHMLKDFTGQAVWGELAFHMMMRHTFVTDGQIVELKFPVPCQTVMTQQLKRKRLSGQIRPPNAVLFLTKALAEEAVERFAEQNHISVDASRALMVIFCMSQEIVLAYKGSEIYFVEQPTRDIFAQYLHNRRRFEHVKGAANIGGKI